MRFRALALALFAALLPAHREAPGRPGEIPRWTNANKQGIGTSRTPQSRVWFTLGDGALQEVYFPTVDQADLRLLELVVLDGESLEEETKATVHCVRLKEPRALVFEQVNTARTGRYRISKVTITDPERDTLLVSVRFEPLAEGRFRLFVLIDPAIANSGRHDSGMLDNGALAVWRGGTATALCASPPFSRANVGYLGASEGLLALRKLGELPEYTSARDGNIAGMAELSLKEGREFVLSLGFSGDPHSACETARASLKTPFPDLEARYEAGWKEYLAPLRRGPPGFEDAVAESAMVLKAHEDKTHPGASVASLTVPWGDSNSANGGGIGGYHLVWSRDLYHVATALLALGDRKGAESALDYLFKVQELKNGSFPQNTWLDGRAFWPSLQLDEVAYPLILAGVLGRNDRASYEAYVRPAAAFIARTGPQTPQERWEEEEGYSPATIAAEIAGLLSAAVIAEENGDGPSSHTWRQTADSWSARLEEWTVTRTGPLDPRPYYLRITRNGRPDEGRRIRLKNGGGTFDEREIVDQSFLELVRLGVRKADDPIVVRSLAVVDHALRVMTPKGPGFYRYNHDGYGEKPDGGGYDGTGVGRLWPLLTGERGEFELAAGRDALPYLRALVAFGNEGGMLPEQIWDREESPKPHLRFGEGTGSATPLAWASAELVRLALSIEAGHNLSTPAAVSTHFDRR